MATSQSHYEGLRHGDKNNRMSIFLAFIASVECQHAALFRVNKALFGKEDTEMSLQGCAVDFSMHLTEKIACVLKTQHGAGPFKMSRERTYQVIREEFDPFGPEEVYRARRTISIATCQLDLWLCCLVKAAREVTCGWVLVMVNSSVKKGVVLANFKKCTSAPSSQEAGSGPHHSGQFSSGSHLS